MMEWREKLWRVLQKFWSKDGPSELLWVGSGMFPNDSCVGGLVFTWCYWEEVETVELGLGCRK
jgi:hypothetical protein